MTQRAKKLIACVGIALGVYMVAYLLSVRIDYAPTKIGNLPIPRYRPWDGDRIHGLFWPAHLVDQGYLRPARWGFQEVDPGHRR